MASNLIAVIREKQEAIAKLQAELDEARALLTGTQTGRSTSAPRKEHDPIPPAPVPQRRTRSTSRSRRRKQGFKAAKGEIVETSSVGRTVNVLRRAGKPLHVDEILRLLGVEGPPVKKTTLVGNLSTYVNEERVFNRPAPSVYGLIDARKG